MPASPPFIVTNVPVQPTNTFAVYQNAEPAPVPAGLMPYQAEVGDTVLFFNATNGVVFDRATVTAVNLPNITFDHAISNVVAGTYDTNTLLLNQNPEHFGGLSGQPVHQLAGFTAFTAAPTTC